MIKTEIATGIIRYQFPPHEGKQFGFNLHALLDEHTKSALLVDTGYEEHASSVLDDLQGSGWELKAAVISHFHPDHVLGIHALPPIEVIGSSRHEETLRQFGPREEWESLVPSRLTQENSEISFGRFRLRFIMSPGHAPCSQYTVIDDAFIHVADNIMTTNDCRDILPWAEFDLITDHIASLMALREFNDRSFLLSHGCELTDQDTKRRAIDNRIRYFRNVLDGAGAFTYEEATRGCTCTFLHQEWLIRKENG
ncbi:MBL fold metallo-hydrolase [Candidatus Bipolaricaulota bacterium]